MRNSRTLAVITASLLLLLAVHQVSAAEIAAAAPSNDLRLAQADSRLADEFTKRIGPRIEFKSRFIDLGNIPLDTLATWSFMFRNVGDEILRITNKFNRDHGIIMKVLEGC